MLSTDRQSFIETETKISTWHGGNFICSAFREKQILSITLILKPEKNA